MTEQVSGRFILTVRRAGQSDWRILETFYFDDLALRKAERRVGVLDQVQSRRAGWQDRGPYYMRDADYRIEEGSVNRTDKRGLRLISGTAYTDAERLARAA